MQSLNNSRIIQALVFHLATLPMVYNPIFDVGAWSQMFIWILICLLSQGTVIPGRIAMYNRIHSETAIGLVGYPSFMSFLVCLHDVFLSCCLIAILLAIHSTSFKHTARYSLLHLFGACALISLHQSSWQAAPPMSGFAFASCNLIQTVDFFQAFFVGNPFSPSKLVGSTNVGFLSPNLMMCELATGASLNPGVPFLFSRTVVLISGSIWICVEFTFWTMPLWISACRRR